MRLKRIGCLVLAVVLSLPLAAPATSYAAGKFKDTAGHWAENYINTAVSKKIITGYPDGRFLPDKAVTRAEFATMVNKALGNTGAENLSFNDVYSGEWYYNDVAKAVSAAYTAGYDDNTFRPNNPITRQEAAVMISRIVPTYGKGGNLRTYSDYRSIADWAYDAMAKVNGKGYIGAYNDGKIHPADQLTRAQTAKIICDILDNETIITSTPVIDDDGTKLSGKIYSNNVTIDEDLGEDSATIDNCVILGTLSVKGGGTDTITVSNSRVANVTVNKDDDPVRILAKGETAIVRLSASQASILQTSGLSGGLFGPGFNNITANSSAEVTLRGTFPRVNVSGSKADLTLESGTIDTLTVNGRYSDITAEKSTTISTATVNVESYFHGSGTISQMNVNADGITYETKPKRWTIKSSADTPTQSDETSDITFSPKNGSTNVKRDAKITITFDSAMKMYDGSTISNSVIDDFVELRKGSSSGSLVSYSASINSAKTVITITPDSALSADTKYYVIMDKNSLRNSAGNGNVAQSIYFSTGDAYGNVTTTFSPENGATTVPVNTGITISFSDAVVRYSNGATISSSDSYLTDCLIFRETNSSGKTVSYTASINSTKRTITITPKSNLTLNQKYYVAVVGNKLKTRDGGEAIPSASVTWTTGVTTPVLSALTLTPGERFMKVDFTPNIAGDVYALAISGSNLVPTEDQILKGTRTTVKANTASTLTISDLSPNTPYTVYALLRSSNVNSKVVSASKSTKIEEAALSSLMVSSGGQNRLSGFSAENKNYTVTVPFGTNTVDVSATAGSGVAVEINGEGTSQKSVELTGVKSEIKVKVSTSGKADSIYTITVQVQGNTEVQTVTIGGKSFGTSNSYATSIAYDATKTAIQVVAKDSNASINLETSSGIGTLELPELSLSPGDNTFTFTISSNGESKTYTILLTREAPPA